MELIKTTSSTAKQSTLQFGPVSSLLLVISVFICGFLTIWSVLSCIPDRKLAFTHYAIARTIALQILYLSGDIPAFLIGFNYFGIVKIFRTKIFVAVTCFCTALAVTIMPVIIVLLGIKLPVVLLAVVYIIERLGLLTVVLFLVLGKNAAKTEQANENRGNQNDHK